MKTDGKALICGSCNSLAKTFIVAENIKPGTCLLFQCSKKQNAGKKCFGWYYCVACQDKVDRRRAKEHFSCKKHYKALGIAFLTPGNEEDDEPSAAAVVTLDEDNTSSSSAYININNDVDDDTSTIRTSTVAPAFPSARESTRATEVRGGDQAHTIMPLAYYGVNHNLRQAYSACPDPSLLQVCESFGLQNNMMFFHVAEWAKEGGGIQYLVSRAFRKTESIYETDITASLQEAEWHFGCFVQYVSMGDEQRKRQASIIGVLVNSFQATKSSLFQATRVLTYKELNKYYGRSNQHTIWNSLPIPQPDNIFGIAYTNPVNAVRYLLALAKTEVDDFFVDVEDAGNPPSSPATVHHITESAAALRWKQEVLEDILSSASEQFRATFPKVLLLWAVDWRDGFGANRTKQNRKSTNGWTFSLSTPKQHVNSLSNTLPIALGLKKNPHWRLVEHRFREDMKELGHGLKPIMVYHGGLKKCIPVFIRRLACLTDKVERGDYTSTLSCTSKYHRYYGKIVRFEPPTLDIRTISFLLANEKAGLSVNHYGWSCDMVHRVKNGGSFPACYNCRMETVEWLKKPDFGTLPSDTCSICANWTLSDSTKILMSFDAPKDYPTVDRCLPDCPVSPPQGREPGLQRLCYLSLDFSTMIKAMKYAFFHCKSGRNTGWTKAMCKAYLRTCGVNGKEQDLLYTAAATAHRNPEEVVDYNLPGKVGIYVFPAAYTGDMKLNLFIEMLMHLLFLGIAESNFKLQNLYMQEFGRPEATFKNTIQPLLLVLVKFNLSWLLALPFSGTKKGKLTTGTWVSENWLAWTRLSKVVYGYCFRRGEQDVLLGSNDLARMVTSFVALVARVLSHSGATKQNTLSIQYILKEFLSCVRELDVRTRYVKMNQLATSGGNMEEGGGNASDEKSKDQWWLKSNYVSCLNLPSTISELGPLINLWDGGGKGERYIQEIKPHIPRGVRDGGSFFVRLLEKVYKTNCINHIGGQLSSTEDDNTPSLSKGDSGEEQEIGVDATDRHIDRDIDGDDVSDFSEVSAASSNLSNPPPIDDILVPSNTDGHPSDSDSDDDEEELPDEEEEKWSTPMEEEQMSKARTYFVYKRESELQQSIDNHEPFAGILISAEDGSPEMHVLYKKPKSLVRLGWRKVTFDDTQGVLVCGLWYAPISSFEEADSPPVSLKEVTSIAKSATVAIPLRYTFGNNHQDSLKYCVLTNWWRERNRDGKYLLPTLAFELYQNGNS